MGFSVSSLSSESEGWKKHVLAGIRTRDLWTPRPRTPLAGHRGTAPRAAIPYPSVTPVYDVSGRIPIFNNEI